jgi:hypothetical protein
MPTMALLCFPAMDYLSSCALLHTQSLRGSSVGRKVTMHLFPLRCFTWAGAPGCANSGGSLGGADGPAPRAGRAQPSPWGRLPTGMWVP